jgi:hypothetical protein
MKKILALACTALLAACSGGDDAPSDAYEPNDSAAEATPFTVGGSRVATISTGTDYDYYEVTLPAAATLRIQTFDAGGTSCDLQNDSVDPYVEVLNASETTIDWDDDSGINLCEDFTTYLTAGTYYVVVAGFPSYPFRYTLRITEL